MSEETYNGTCLCESIKFTLRGKPGKTMACYCVDCQKNAGGPCQIMAAYYTSNISISDPSNYLRIYTITRGTASGMPKEKQFCANCGCTLWTVPLKYEGKMRMVRTSLIEDGLTIFTPATELFKDSKA